MKVISLPYIFQILYVLCFTRPRYQVSVYRTIDPLVLIHRLMFPRHVSIETEEVDTGARGNLVLYKKRCRYKNTKLFSYFYRMTVLFHMP